MRLLVAEDDPKLLKSLIHIFEVNHYVVDGVSNGADAYDYALTEEYDGLILDIMMPEKDGITVLRELRARGVHTPALFLSARTEVYQRVEGLDAGADDYLPKPFSTVELVARVRAMLRRRDNFTPDVIPFFSVLLNKSTLELEYGDRKIALSVRELHIMEMLTERVGALVTTEAIITHIWGWDTDVDTSVVWVHVSNLRKKLDAIGAPVRIRFIRGAGYVLEADE